ncbi:hypothetical protein HPB49_019900 [Dermacentor silvarum]|uniref:Uncharacterized protein n=1 Tax=Dermacentor silvarum TaxID=543639 RepID=A0ACB8CZ72_DERSI|nr:hypothetical protein HPB49_019900 [Dermacentor silvarum]
MRPGGSLASPREPCADGDGRRKPFSRAAEPEEGWINEDLVLDWLKSMGCRRPSALFRFPSILVMDAFRGHLADSVKRLLRDSGTELVVIQCGMTSQLQPLDVCANKPLRDAVKRCYAEWMRSASAEDLVRRAFKKCGISNALNGTEDHYLREDLSDKELSGERSTEDGKH